MLTPWVHLSGGGFAVSASTLGSIGGAIALLALGVLGLSLVVLLVAVRDGVGTP